MRGISIIWPAVFWASIAGAALSADAGPAAPAAPGHLRCEYRVTPMGLDEPHPRLSWELRDGRRGAVQKAYRLIVSADPKAPETGPALVWDTGKVESDQSIQVIYQGPALKPKSRYYWKVRTWDGADQPSPWSEITWWEMGLPAKTPWEASWITIPLHADLACEKYPPEFSMAQCQWIWGTTSPTYVRRRFVIPDDGKIGKAVLRVTAVEACLVLVNGKPVGQSQTSNPEAWGKPDEFDIAPLIRGGPNVVAVEAKGDGKTRKLAVGAEIRLSDGRGINLVSDRAWLCAGVAADGWQTAAFEPRGWQGAKVSGWYSGPPGSHLKRAGSEATRRALCLRKEFDLPGPPARARAYVSAQGCYVLAINGRRASDEVFAPGRAGKGSRGLEYQTLDVTGLLVPGRNALAATVGSGWWNGMGSGGGERPRLILQLEAELDTGQVVRVRTDPTWKVHVSPIRDDAIYDGEKYDARLEMPGWDRAGFDERGWIAGEVVEGPKSFIPPETLPMRCVEEHKPRHVEKRREGSFRFDFGQNASGVCRLRVRGAESGRKITIRYEEAPPGTGGCEVSNVDEYVCRGAAEEGWHPEFTYGGFRYAIVENFPGEADAGSLVRRVIHNDVPLTGAFECSSDLLNRIWHNAVWSVRSNMHGFLTDCPQRRERGAWTGDVQVSAHADCYFMDLSTFLDKFARGASANQGYGWADVHVTVPWLLYGFYGDRRALETHYRTIKNLVDGRKKTAKGHIAQGHTFGDWWPPDLKGDRAVDKEICAQAYYYYSAEMAARIAALLGKADEHRTYAELAAAVRDAFMTQFVNPKTAVIATGSQTSYVLPLRFGMLAEPLRAAAFANLAADVEKRNYHLSTGFLGTQHLLTVLSDGGRHDAAWRIAIQETEPSWGYMVTKGATTLWEAWHGRASHNHHAYACVGQWLMEYLAGIRFDPARPGFKRILIQPMPAGELKWARGEYRSIHGPIRSRWDIEADGTFVLRVTVPANTGAEVRLPLMGKTRPGITEGDAPAEKAEGVRALGVQGDRAVFECGGGSYLWRVR